MVIKPDESIVKSDVKSSISFHNCDSYAEFAAQDVVSKLLPLELLLGLDLASVHISVGNYDTGDHAADESENPYLHSDLFVHV